jgi:hypothetical protein
LKWLNPPFFGKDRGTFRGSKGTFDKTESFKASDLDSKEFETMPPLFNSREVLYRDAQ